MSALYSILAIGGAAGVGYIIYSLFSGGGGDLAEKMRGVFQKKKHEEIEQLEERKKDVVKKVIKSKKIAEEKKQEVKKIVEKANKEIVETLDKDDLAVLLEEEAALWD